MEVSENLGIRYRKVSEEILTRSRNELYFQMPYLGLALSSLAFVVTTEFSLGTDGAALVVHPKVLADLFTRDRKEVNRFFLHEVYHCLFRHIFKPIPEAEGLWNLAADMAVEFLIDDGNFRATRTGISRFRQNLRAELSANVRVLNAESIYRELRKRAPGEEEMLRMAREVSRDDHSLWPSQRNRSAKAPMPLPEKALRDKWKEISEKTQTRMESLEGEGKGGGDFLEQTRVENRERYNYRTFLRKFSVLREEMHVDPDSFDPVLYTYGLSFYGNLPLVELMESREERKIEEFVIVIDVSMSVTGPLVKSFLEQTYQVLSESESFFRKVHVRILQCDEEVKADRKISSRRDLEEYMQNLTLTGHGGTDFRPAFAYVEKLIEAGELFNLRGLLYFTDGKGIYPKKKTPYETAFVFCEEDYEDQNVPAWAIKLILPREELAVKKKKLEDNRFVWEEK